MISMTKIIQIITSIFLLAYLSTALASEPLSVTANALMEPVGYFTHLAFQFCYILAIMLLLSTLTLYRNYRQNSNQTPLGRVVTMLLLTIVTALIPTIGSLSLAASYLNL